MAFEGAPPGRPHPLPAPKGSRLPDQRHRDAAHAEPRPSRARVGWAKTGPGQAPQRPHPCTPALCWGQRRTRRPKKCGRKGNNSAKACVSSWKFVKNWSNVFRFFFQRYIAFCDVLYLLFCLFLLIIYQQVVFPKILLKNLFTFIRKTFTTKHNVI